MTRNAPCAGTGSPHSHEHASARERVATEPQRPLQPLPWEAAYEPGGGSSCLIGHYATEHLAQHAAETWLVAQRRAGIGTLTWDDGRLVEIYTGIEIDIGIVVRRRETQTAPTPAQAAAKTWNERHPEGTPVSYWTGERDGAGKTGVTRSPAMVLGGHTAVVWVTGEPSCIALTHVEPITGEQP